MTTLTDLLVGEPEVELADLVPTPRTAEVFALHPHLGAEGFGHIPHPLDRSWPGSESSVARCSSSIALGCLSRRSQRQYAGTQAVEEATVAVHEDTRDLKELAQVDPDSILDRLNENLQRKMPSYRDLYLRWERLNWSVAELDFSQDRKDWQALDDHHRERLLWTLAAFYVAEQRVAATLTPYVSAAPKVEQKVFLATQCVDEARHTVFFDRWFEEVVAAGDGDLARRLRSGRQWVGPGFAPLFDEYLEDVAQQLRDNPERRPDVRQGDRRVSHRHRRSAGADGSEVHLGVGAQRRASARIPRRLHCGGAR